MSTDSIQDQSAVFSTVMSEAERRAYARIIDESKKLKKLQEIALQAIQGSSPNATRATFGAVKPKQTPSFMLDKLLADLKDDALKAEAKRLQAKVIVQTPYGKPLYLSFDTVEEATIAEILVFLQKCAKAKEARDIIADGQYRSRQVELELAKAKAKAKANTKKPWK